MQSTYPLRLDEREKRLFKQAARSSGLSLAEFFREAAREKAVKGKRTFACLSYPKIEIDPEAESNPREYIRKQLTKIHDRNR